MKNTKKRLSIRQIFPKVGKTPKSVGQLAKTTKNPLQTTEYVALTLGRHKKKHSRASRQARTCTYAHDFQSIDLAQKLVFDIESLLSLPFSELLKTLKKLNRVQLSKLKLQTHNPFYLAQVCQSLNDEDFLIFEQLLRLFALQNTFIAEHEFNGAIITTENDFLLANRALKTHKIAQLQKELRSHHLLKIKAVLDQNFLNKAFSLEQFSAHTFLCINIIESCFKILCIQGILQFTPEDTQQQLEENYSYQENKYQKINKTRVYE